jgi:hypothetical protein
VIILSFVVQNFLVYSSLNSKTQKYLSIRNLSQINLYRLYSRLYLQTLTGKYKQVKSYSFYSKYYNYAEILKSMKHVSKFSCKLSTPINNNLELSINYNFLSLLATNLNSLSHPPLTPKYLMPFQNIVLPIFKLVYNNTLYLYYLSLISPYFSVYTGYSIKTPFI